MKKVFYGKQIAAIATTMRSNKIARDGSLIAVQSSADGIVDHLFPDRL
jgi:hypothetical protein